MKETREPALVVAFTTANDITAQSVELAAAVQGHVSKAHTGQLNKNGSACKTSRARVASRAQALSRVALSASAWTEGTQIFGAAFGTTWVVIWPSQGPASHPHTASRPDTLVQRTTSSAPSSGGGALRPSLFLACSGPDVDALFVVRAFLVVRLQLLRCCCHLLVYRSLLTCTH